MKSIRTIFALALVLSLLGCKKDEKVETKEYMAGYIELRFPEFVEPGASKTFALDSMMTVSRPDGGKVGYFYRDVNSSKSDTLVTTDGLVVKDKFVITAPTSLGKHSFMFGAIASEKYYSSSKTCNFNVVKPGFNNDASLSNFPGSKSSFVDERDGKKYYTTKVGSTEWMMNNLAWEGKGRAYDDCAVMSYIFGRYYSFEEAQASCPAGWRLPSEADLSSLVQACGLSAEASADIKGIAGKVMGDLYFNSEKMWEFSRDVKISNSTSLSIMPTGYVQKEGNSYRQQDLYKYAAFWTSEMIDDKAVLRYIYKDSDVLYLGLVSKSDFLAPVRCVK